MDFRWRSRTKVVFLVSGVVGLLLLRLSVLTGPLTGCSGGLVPRSNTGPGRQQQSPEVENDAFPRGQSTTVELEQCDVSSYFQSFLYRFDCSWANNSFQQNLPGRNPRHCKIEATYGNCELLQSFFLYGKDYLTTEELQFPLAFSLTIRRSPNQAFQLLRTIYRRHNAYYIHIDNGSPDTVRAVFRGLAGCFDNILVVPDRAAGALSGIPGVEAELKRMEAAFRGSVKWKYYINIADEEFPLKTNLQIVQALKVLNGTNDIQSWDANKEELPERVALRTSSRLSRKTSRAITTEEWQYKFSPNIKIRKGGGYGLFSRAFLQFVQENPTAVRFVQWLNETRSPERFLWATLNSLADAPGGFVGEISHRRRSYMSRAMLMTWERPRCQGKHEGDVCVFGTGDVPWLLKRPELFANNFSEDFDRQVLYCLERDLMERLTNIQFIVPQTTFYKNLPHVKNDAIDLTPNKQHL